MKKYAAIIILASTIIAPNVFASTPTPSKQPFFKALDNFRVDIYSKIRVGKDTTQKELTALDKGKNKAPAKPLDATEKPIAYIKLFLLSIAGFIFSTQIVFYVVLALLAFLILRSIFRKFRKK